ncbi:MAG: YraN family protein [Planctomycetota bacterium]
MLGGLLRLAPTGALLWLLRRDARSTAGSGGLAAAELGAVGEEIAARTLCAEGWRVVGRNVRAAEGELDLVAFDGAVLVVVEVKTGRVPAGRLGPGDRWRPADRVSWIDVRRRAAAARRMARGGAWRVDVVEVVTPGRPQDAGSGASRGAGRTADTKTRVLRTTRA